MATLQPKASLFADPVPFNCHSQPNETRQATPSSTVTQTATVDAGKNLNNKMDNFDRYFFFIIKPTRCTNFTYLFWHETLHASDSSSVHHQEFVHCTISYGMSYSFRAGPGWNCSSILVLPEGCLQTCMTYTIAECTVNKLLMMDRGAVRNM